MTADPLVTGGTPQSCWSPFEGQSHGSTPRCGRPEGHEGQHSALVYGSADPESIREERW